MVSFHNVGVEWDLMTYFEYLQGIKPGDIVVMEENGINLTPMLVAMVTDEEIFSRFCFSRMTGQLIFRDPEIAARIRLREPSGVPRPSDLP